MFISPMLLQTAESAFNSFDHIFEPKIDGHRLLYVRRAGSTRLYTRHDNECSRQYPELHGTSLVDVILDGEVARLDPTTNKVDFEAIMQRFQTRNSDKIRRLAVTHPVSYIVFDILRYNGEDTTNLPLTIRKELLRDIVFDNPQIAVIPFVEGKGKELFKEIRRRKMEGIVAKLKESIYTIGRRSASWQKIINWQSAEVVITGWRKDNFGWIAAIETENGPNPVGIIEFGTTPTQRQAFYNVAKAIVTYENNEYVYIQPRIRAQVKMRNWTKNGLLRDPVFVDFIV